MMSFRGGRLARVSLPLSSVGLMSDVSEAKGRQDLFARQSPQLLKALRDLALIQSTESSNRIEGVTVDPDRLRPLVLGGSKPRSRPEEEVQNYRRALNLIHTGAAGLPVTPETLRKLHATIQDGAGDAGKWKRVMNEITEVRPGQAPVLRFRPVSVEATPAAAEEVCRSYRYAIDQEHVPPLVASACLVLDFLCIHPFRDGNGRAARLLTLLVLYQHGYEVGRYVSLEKLIEEQKDGYYETLKASSEGWHEGKHDLLPWLGFFLTIVRRAYREFERRAGEMTSAKGAKTVLLLEAIQSYPGEFAAAELHRAVPGVSLDHVRAVLEAERKAGRAQCSGRGPKAKWKGIR